MTKTVALLAQGAMGAAVGRRLVDGGVTVITDLTGRGAASCRRAEAAGMVDTGVAAFGEADVFLSIVPPDHAMATARHVLPHLSEHIPYVDCNAVSPATVRAIARIASDTGIPFIDASIIGPPPEPGATDTVFYASGDTLTLLLDLANHGLDVRTLDGGIGAASALKMCYAGIAKGLTGLAAAMMVAATREGAADALRAELARSQPEILGLLKPRIPDMLPKAYRWAGEMQEIAAFVGPDGAAEIYRGLATMFAKLAEDVAGPRADAKALETFIA